MKRKTNLFYITGQDSKFLTFSNYTESLTGNYLSVDTKLFPSRFLCLYMPGLTETVKQDIITYLVRYYENKLAMLRDDCMAKGKSYESKMYILAYLIEALCNIYINNGKLCYVSDLNDSEKAAKIAYNKENLIAYVGDISEQDYNGTYTDTICNIDPTVFKAGIITTEEDTSAVDTVSNTSSECLYGWDDKTMMPSTYSDVTPLYDSTDNGNLYKYNTDYSYITLVNKFLDNKSETLTFNIVIPLYDVVDINYKTNSVGIEDISTIRLKPESQSDNSLCIKDLPLGIWFKPDIPIVLKKDSETGFSQSWSLVVSSQFKPFPYSKKLPSEISNESKSNSFATFAMVLSKQNEILEKFNELEKIIRSNSKRISNLESKMNNIGTQSNIDGLYTKMATYKQELDANYNEVVNNVKEYFENQKWQTQI